MRVIRRAADHRVDILLLEALSPVHILLRFGKFIGGKTQVILVDITQGHHVFSRHAPKVRLASPPRSDQSDIEFVARSVGAEQSGFWKNKSSRPGECHAPEKLASFHAARLIRTSEIVKHAQD